MMIIGFAACLIGIALGIWRIEARLVDLHGEAAKHTVYLSDIAEALDHLPERR